MQIDTRTLANLTSSRPSHCLSEMLESSNLVTFNGLANSSSYDAFLLDEERGRLLVGAEDHIFSFDLVNINRDHKQVRFKYYSTFFSPAARVTFMDMFES